MRNPPTTNGSSNCTETLAVFLGLIVYDGLIMTKISPIGQKISMKPELTWFFYRTRKLIKLFLLSTSRSNPCAQDIEIVRAFSLFISQTFPLIEFTKHILDRLDYRFPTQKKQQCKKEREETTRKKGT